MTSEGTVRNGVVVLGSGATFPDGARVTVTLLEQASPPNVAAIPTILERYAEIVGIAPELPPDMAKNHDHYIHGTPKK